MEAAPFPPQKVGAVGELQGGVGIFAGFQVIPGIQRHTWLERALSVRGTEVAVDLALHLDDLHGGVLTAEPLPIGVELDAGHDLRQRPGGLSLDLRHGLATITQ